MQKKRKLEHSNYTCSVCRKELPVRYFNVTVLLNLEAEDKTYKATCSICEASAVDTEHASQETVRCKVYKTAKPLHAFSPAHRSQRKSTWACPECQYPTCSASGCKTKPEKPQTSGNWMCSSCRYPPCVGCGIDRPRRSNSKDNSVTETPIWKCADCRGKYRHSFSVPS